MKKVSKYFGVAMLLLLTVCVSSVLGACSKDDDKQSTFMVNDKKHVIKEVKAVSMMGMHVISIISTDGETVNFSVSSSQDSKDIDLTKGGVWTVQAQGINANGMTQVLEKGSYVNIHKTGDNAYKFTFTFIQTQNNKQTTVKGSYNGKTTAVKFGS